MGRGKPYLLLDEFQHPHLDGTIQLCTLACCAWVRCECVDKVHEIVQHEHRTVPCGGGGSLSPKSHVIIPSTATHTLAAGSTRLLLVLREIHEEERVM
jgi:hypothetical protein